MNSSLFRLGAFGFIVLCLSACNFKEDKTTAATPPSTGEVTTELRFADVKTQVLDRSCSCHIAGNDGGVSLKTYSLTLNAINNRNFRKVTLGAERRMPPPNGDLDAAQTAVLQEWLDAGAPE
jgi:hypothetical protein